MRQVVKRRLRASVDPGLLVAAREATERGEAPTLTAWINDAIRLKLEHDARLRAMSAFIAEYEAKRGPITAKDVEDAVREAKRRAISVRGSRAGGVRRK
jgi:hypothetical protein